MINISKKRRWLKNEYDVYQFNKNQRGDFLNVWFSDEILYYPLTIKGQEKGKIGKVLTSDNLWTLKKVDKESANHLYNRVYNPVFVHIGCDHYLSGKNKKVIYVMKACIKSIDDSSYGIWWIDRDLDYLYAQRIAILKYVDSCKELNGEQFLNYCISLGADEDQKDYN